MKKLNLPQKTVDAKESIRLKARQYAQHRFAEREAESAKKEVGSGLLALMLDEKITKQKVLVDSSTEATVSVKTRENMTIDEERLKKAIGAPAFNRLTTPVLDEAKVEAAIQLGDLDPNVVAACTSTNDTNYLEARFKAVKPKKES